MESGIFKEILFNLGGGEGEKGRNARGQKARRKLIPYTHRGTSYSSKMIKNAILLLDHECNTILGRRHSKLLSAI